MLVLRLVRHNYTLDYTEGSLFDETTKKRLCDTLEDRYRKPGVKVRGKTAIQPGEYNIKATYSPKFKKRMVLIEDVDMFEGIRMHYGKSADNTEGCILVGEKERDGILNNSYMTHKLVELLDNHGNDGILEII